MRLRARPLFCLVLLATAACSDARKGTLPTPSGAPGLTGEPPHEAKAEAEEAPDFGPRGEAAPRGFGSVRARVPGTSQLVSSIRLVSHHVDAVVQGGFARTEVEEEILNEGDAPLEARLTFTLPEGAVLTRLGLVVNGKLVEAEIEEKQRIAKVFKGIVDDTVRPKDPALLEHLAGSRYSLTIFPVPPKGKRKAVFAYDEALPSANGVATYRLPIGAAGARATHVDDLAVKVRVRGAADVLSEGWDTEPQAAESPDDLGGKVLSFSRQNVAPSDDFVVRITEPAATKDTVRAAIYTPKVGELAAKKDDKEAPFVALRVPLPPPEGAPACTVPPPRLAIVIDTSHGQSAESLRATRERVFKALGTLDAQTAVSLLACDSACETAPFQGPRPSRRAVDAWLAARTPHGSADVGGALAAGLAALGDTKGSALLYIGEGAPTAGELATAPLIARFAKKVEDARVDVLFLGEGRGVDDVVLGQLARGLGGLRLRGSDVDTLGGFLLAPRVRGLTIELPSSVAAAPAGWPTQAAFGHDLVVLARSSGSLGGELVVKGKVNGADYRHAYPVTVAEGQPENPLVPKLWSKARIDELEQGGDPTRIAEAIALSKRAHVMSRHTSLVALENEGMFAAYGIKRTTRDASDQSDNAFGGGAKGADLAGLAGFGAGHGRLGDNAPAMGLGMSGSGADTSGAKGNMWGTPLGDFPAGGLGIGSGSASHRTTRAPTLRLGAASVSGRLPPEIVQRIVRSNFGRYRHCYQQGLLQNPDLSGTVILKFVIGRDGNVATTSASGGTLPAPQVHACIARAAASLSFPAPEGGIVSVTYPLTFSSEERSPSSQPNRWSPPPSVTQVAGADTWMSGDEEKITKLREAAANAGDKRTPRENLVKGLVLRGRFAESLTAARDLAALDPDSALAWSLVAESSILTGDRAAALGALDTTAALDPSAVAPHIQAGNAFQAAGDVNRSCAHFRALVTLPDAPDAALAEAMRCRAVVLGERAEAVAEGRAYKKPGPQVTAMIKALEANESPAYQNPSPAGAISAATTCEGECPLLAVITPRGRVVSALTPGTSRSTTTAISTSRIVGNYRTVLIGTRGAPATITVKGEDFTQAFPAAPDGPRTVVTTTVLHDLRAGFGWGFGRLGGG